MVRPSLRFNCSFNALKGTRFSHPFGANRRRFTISALFALRQNFKYHGIQPD